MLRIIAIAALVGLHCSVAIAEDCPPEIQALLVKCLEARRAAIARFDHHLDFLIKNLATTRVATTFKPQAEKNRLIVDLQQQLKTSCARMIELRLGNELLLPIFDPQLRAGQIGETFTDLKVDKIIDERNAIVTCELRTQDLMDSAKRTFWLKGYDTKNWAVGKTVEVVFLEVQVLRDTYEYPPGGGKIPIVEKYDTSIARKCFRVIPLVEFESRKWRVESEDDSFTAVVVGYDADLVRLRKLDGKVSAIPAAKLRKTDRQYIEQEVRPRYVVRKVVAAELPDFWRDVQPDLNQLASQAINSPAETERSER